MISVSYNRIIGFELPFNIPHARSVEMHSNLFRDIACSVRNYPSYFSGLPMTNVFEGESTECPILISSARREYESRNGDRRTTFRLARALYHCQNEPSLSAQECCQSKRNSIALYKQAAEMGVTGLGDPDSYLQSEPICAE